MSSRSEHDNLDRHGFAMVRGVVDATLRQALLADLGPVSGAGRRGILAIPTVAKLARSPKLLAHVRSHVAVEAFPVRGIYFDKSCESNWLVAWHQDTSIAVEERRDVIGFGPWSVKEGVPHVRPPVGVLERMLAVRIHLDDADESNGALHVVLGSHKFGLLSSERVQELQVAEGIDCCVAAAGDVMLMRPLLLHSSSRSTVPKHRRVLHIEYAAYKLPGDLKWHEAA